MSTVQVLVDDTSNNFTFSGAQWTTDTQTSFFGGSTRMHADKNPGTVQFVFQGIQAALMAATFRSDTQNPALRNMTVVIDNNEPYTTGANCLPTPVESCQFYQTPALDDGLHTLTLSNLPEGEAFDYAVVTLGSGNNESYVQSTTDTILAIDDRDPRFVFTSASSTAGGWSDTHAVGIFVMPFQNNSRQSTTVGDSFSVKFSGTSATLYGVLYSKSTGSLSVTYTVDGGTPLQHFYPQSSGSQAKGSYTVYPTSSLFQSGTLGPGEHTLEGKITECTDQTFIVDFLAYTVPGVKLAETSTKDTTTSNDAVKTTTAVGPIVGGVLGGLVILAVGAVLLWYYLRKKRREKAARVIPTPDDVFLRAEPFVLPAMIERSPSMAARVAQLQNLSPYERKREGERLRNEEARLRAELERTEGGLALYGIRDLTRPLISFSNDSHLALHPNYSDAGGESTGTESFTGSDGGHAASTSALVGQLQRRINELTEENAILAELPPPMYDGDMEAQSSNASGSRHGNIGAH